MFFPFKVFPFKHIPFFICDAHTWKCVGAHTCACMYVHACIYICMMCVCMCDPKLVFFNTWFSFSCQKGITILVRLFENDVFEWTHHSLINTTISSVFSLHNTLTNYPFQFHRKNTHTHPPYMDWWISSKSKVDQRK